jgi:chromosome segregation ATPase
VSGARYKRDPRERERAVAQATIERLQEQLAHANSSRSLVEARVEMLERGDVERNKKIAELEAKAKTLEADAADRKNRLETLSREIDLYERIEDGLAAKVELLEGRAKNKGSPWPLLATAGAAMLGGIVGNKLGSKLGGGA